MSRLSLVAVFEILFDLMHEDCVDGFLYCWEDVEYAIELGYLDQFRGVFGQAGEDEDTAVFLNNPVADEQGTQSGRIGIFYLRQIEDDVANAFCVQGD